MRPETQPSHLPVMWAQVMDGLQVRRDGRYLDGTFGRGGHARGVLDRLGPDGRLLVMDKDPEAIATAHALFGADGRVAVRRGSFAGMAQWDAAAAGLDGVLLDLGVSSPQLDVAERGFSFGKDGPLDMRMDPDSGESAAQWLARHGVKVTVQRDVAADSDVGGVILSRAADLDADLIVMGVYGHSRVREMVLGGASRTLLASMTVPVFISH